MIQRYRFIRCKLHFDPHVCLCSAREHPDGDYVLYSDHLAALSTEAEKVRKLRELLQAANHGLRSYQYGNSSAELAEEMADQIDIALKETGD